MRGSGTFAAVRSDAARPWPGRDEADEHDGPQLQPEAEAGRAPGAKQLPSGRGLAFSEMSMCSSSKVLTQCPLCAIHDLIGVRVACRHWKM